MMMLTMIARCRAPQDQAFHPLSVLNRIIQRKEASEAPAADDDFCLFSSKALSYPLNVVNYLLESVRPGVATLAMPAVVK